MATRSADSRLSILLESPGQEHLSINGTRLPTHNQVLLCHLSHIEKFRSKDNTRQNNCSVPSARATFEQVKSTISKLILRCYRNSNVFLR